MLGTANRESGYRRKSTYTRFKAQTGKGKIIEPVATPVATSPPSFLSLPNIPKSVPRLYEFDTASTCVANIALHLLDLGVVTESEAIMPLQDIVKQSLNRWCRSKTKDLECFSPILMVSDTFAGIGGYAVDADTVLEQESITPETSIVALGITFDNTKCFTLKDKCDTLHTVEPDFIEFVIQKLYHSLCVMFAVTPELAHDTADMFYWDCYDDSDEEPYVTKEEFYKIIPEWVANPTYKEGWVKEFDRCLEHDNENIRKIAQHILTWQDIEHTRKSDVLPYYPDQVSDDGCTTIQNGTWISWDENELFDRIIDDWGEYHYQTSTTDLNNFFVVPATKQGIEKGLTLLEYYFVRLEWADKLLRLVGKIR
ncbi:hypothetical protein [Pelobacter propionicus]|uniref:PRTRC system protein F n=1 Tax=Pelobacter propionicus (strain DSM 2379 / NBRC 103807 / OttBd1) TaxID=338966 RepID=A0R7U6_PELPD|nr:hypothetical protein [Pelobacter propionicus]ABL01411.1 hypothetical protein Ppro_3823 [Pelobacter propionicus DSM 2379]